MNWILLTLMALNLGLLLWWMWRSAAGAGEQAQIHEGLQSLAIELKAQQTLMGQQVDRQAQAERALREDLQRSASANRQELAQALTQSLGLMQQTLQGQVGDATRTQNEQLDSFRVQLATMQQAMAEQWRLLGEANDRRLTELRTTVEGRLKALQDDNEKRLEQMRQTVDEKRLDPKKD
ncbi:hypothetical protein [Undibacterium luofuense]|uniref:hypothetical protein n=1 Tax=Undibacterium luofuense TaxID=2828733 RepID=UPI0030EF5B18